jgi:Protein of unknown function (DUF3383)
MTIPASSIVKINPAVLNAGGAGVVLNALYLTESLLMPTATVLSFAPGPSGNLGQNVASFFGIGSPEALQAAIYFAGYQNSTLTPSAMLFAAYNAAARAAFLNSGSFANITLTQLKALPAGTLTLTVDGTPITSASINLSGATSFSNAATLILAGFTSPGFTVTWQAATSQFVFTNTLTGTTSTLSFATGTLAAGLLLTSATDALLSQGAAADTPASAMNNAVAESQNWVSMVTMFEPVLADKEAFAAWFNAADSAYLWLAWDSDVQASVSGATEPFGVVAKAAQFDGVACISGDPAAVPAGNTLAAMVLNVASFVAGSIASINFGQTNGRTTLAFLQQSGLLPTCTNSQTAANLLANGYSFYGSYATRNQGFTFFYDSNMPGQFKWIDTFVDDVWMNDQFQVTLMTLVTNIGSAAYNAPGYGSIRSAIVSGPVAAGLNFGAIRTGVKLSSTQIVEVNQQAGGQVDQIISTQGYYLQILDPGAVVRQQRGSPIINFWYTDGGSIQKLTMNSEDIL